jgi:hypothetical protein
VGAARARCADDVQRRHLAGRVERAIDVIDLRLVCTEASDYANPIEPSGTGGKKIADAIAAAVGASAGHATSRVFGRS